MTSYSSAFNAIFLSIKGQLYKAIDTIYPDFKGVFDMILDDIRQWGINGITRRHMQCKINSQTRKTQGHLSFLGLEKVK